MNTCDFETLGLHIFPVLVTHINPMDTNTADMTLALTTTTISITDLSAALHIQLTPQITEPIQNTLNILPYQHEDDDQLPLNRITETTLHFLATTLLLQLHPNAPSEFPSLHAPYIAQTINKALTTCRCIPYQLPAQDPTLEIQLTICQDCNLLIQQAPTTPSMSNQQTPQCITCAREYDNYIYTDKPCQTCLYAALLHQHKPNAWHASHTKDTTNTITSYLTQSQ